jgi:hypothetical protein
MLRMRTWIVAVASIALLGACSQDSTRQWVRHGVAHALRTPKATATAKQDARGGGKGEGRGEGKGRNNPFGDTPVFVDGQYRGALRHNELPAALEVTFRELESGDSVRRYAFVDYLAALGVDLDKVRALHVHGGRRVMIIDGEELRSTGKAAQFKFSHGSYGRPEYRHDGPVDSNTSIDKITAVAVYVDREAPVLEGGKLLVDGKVVDGIPYVAELPAGGTRIYLDGRFVTSIKKHDIAEGLASAVGTLRDLGVDASRVTAAELVSNDKLAAELDGARFARGKLSADVPAQSRGRIAVEGVAGGAPLDAILLYATTRPAARDAVKLGDRGKETDLRLAAQNLGRVGKED